MKFLSFILGQSTILGIKSTRVKPYNNKGNIRDSSAEILTHREAYNLSEGTNMLDLSIPEIKMDKERLSIELSIRNKVLVCSTRYNYNK